MPNVILEVTIPVNMYQYLPGVSPAIFPIQAVDIGIGERRLNNNGLNIQASDVTAEILRLLKRYNNHTLVQIGTAPPKNAPKPPAFVPYYPSFENISAQIYRIFFPYPRRFNTNLSFVRTSGALLKATYYATNTSP